MKTSSSDSLTPSTAKETGQYNEIVMAMECGAIAAPAPAYFDATVLVPVGCREGGNTKCQDCTIGLEYDNRAIETCPVCGAATETYVQFIGIAGIIHHKFTCGTIINVCSHYTTKRPVDNITSIVVGESCYHPDEDCI